MKKHSRLKLVLIVMLIIPLLGALGLFAWLCNLPGNEQIIAAFSSGTRGRTASQIYNVRLAVAALDGKIIPPGKEFSFNHAVGPWTMDRGYRKAPVSFSGDRLLDWGGGVCQASSTLYNAALLAGLPILERHRHHWPASYVPPGQDAAVAYPNIDLRFSNTLTSPIRISARLAGDSVLISFYSKQPAPQVRLERELLGITPPATTVRFEANAAKRASVLGHPGYQVALYRVFPGDEPRRELVSRDTYPPQNRITWR